MLSSKIAVNRERVARENNNLMKTGELEFIWIMKKVYVEEPRAVAEIIRGYTNLEIVSLSFLIASAANIIDMRACDEDISRTQVLHSLGFRAEDPERYDENEIHHGEENELLFSQGHIEESHVQKYPFSFPLYKVFSLPSSK
ncbi:MAG TPA: hypothetical protein VKO45_09615 [Methanomicrobiales archaeon]|nr:hypothetical protein [Methanomicrobiales archaeon]